MTTAVLSGLERGTAVFSACGRYRYELHRAPWGRGPSLFVVAANPSTATDEKDDATCRKIIGFAKRWGYGSISLTNLFAYVSTDPGGMYAQEDPVGPANDAHIARLALSRREVWCAWGDIGGHIDRDRAVMQILADCGCQPFCIGVTAGGFPLHPSRPGYASERVPYGGRPA
ncbi:MAG TPA: DUF1643 domain-containing protein [Polyangiaceae bacterium]|nr:DUF1643 domain-containing protein [Polyangiaceae bacterium]